MIKRIKRGVPSSTTSHGPFFSSDGIRHFQLHFWGSQPSREPWFLPPDVHSYQQSLSDWVGLTCVRSFPGGSAVKNLPANARHVGLIPGVGKTLEEGNDDCLVTNVFVREIPRTEEPIGWQTLDSKKSQTRLSHQNKNSSIFNK